MLVGLLQTIHEASVVGRAPGWSWIASLVFFNVVLYTVVLARPDRARRWLVHLRFGLGAMACLVLATVLGTLVLQQVPAEVFERHYGALAPWLRAAHLHDLFHSWAFLFVLALLVCSQVAMVLHRRRRGWAFALAHGGVALLLVAGMISSRFGARGMVHLEVGDSTDEMQTFAHTPEALPFALRLDAFSTERRAPAWRLRVQERDGAGWRTTASLDGAQAGAHTVDGVGTVEVLAPATTHTAPGDAVQPSADGRGAPAVRLRIGRGEAAETRWLFADGTGRAVTHLPRHGLTIRFLAGPRTRPTPPAGVELWLLASDRTAVVVEDGAVRRSLPYQVRTELRVAGLDLQVRETLASGRWAGLKADSPRASASVQVRVDGKAPVTLHEKRAPWLPLPGGRRLLLSRKADEQINWTASVTLLAGDEVVERSVRVNEPLRWGSYTIHQREHDPENPRYAGLLIVRDPGLPLVYLGLVVMVLGVLGVLFLVPRRRRSGRRRAHPAGGDSRPPVRSAASGGSRPPGAPEDLCETPRVGHDLEERILLRAEATRARRGSP